MLRFTSILNSCCVNKCVAKNDLSDNLSMNYEDYIILYLLCID